MHHDRGLQNDTLSFQKLTFEIMVDLRIFTRLINIYPHPMDLNIQIVISEGAFFVITGRLRMSGISKFPLGN